MSSATDYEEIQRAAQERADIVGKYDLGREEGAQIDPWEDPAFEVYQVTDRYGFIHDSALPKNVDAAEVKAKSVERERTKKWLKMTEMWHKYYPGEKLNRRTYKGIPDCLRGNIWARLLGVAKIKAEQEGIYQTMRNRARTKSTSIRQIDLDVNRTYRNHIMYRERYGVNQQALFHVLAAYSVYNTEIGYCQGMSEIAALLLMYLNEEDAFWGLNQLFISSKHTMHGFFMHGFPKLLRYQEHHGNVLKKFVPKLRRHLERNEMYPTLYTIKWFLQCFLDRTPFHLTLRLWDVYMLDGDQVLVGMAYCIIKMHKRRILKMQMDELLVFFQSGLEKDFSYEDDVVMEQLQICLEELRKARMAVPPKSKKNEAPTLPFGLEIQPSLEQLIGKRTEDTVDEHFRKNAPKGKASYLRRKNASGGGGNSLTTPELGRNHGDTYSVHSRMSQYSMDDKSSYYDTATNSRMSLADFSAKTSAPSSRTSFGDASNLGSMAVLNDEVVDLDMVDLETVDLETVEVTTPTTPTNPPLTPSHQATAPSRPPPTPYIMSQSYELARPTSPAEQTMRTSSSSYDMPHNTIITTYQHSPRVVTSFQFMPRSNSGAEDSPAKASQSSPSSYDNLRASPNASNDHLHPQESSVDPLPFEMSPRSSASYEMATPRESASFEEGRTSFTSSTSPFPLPPPPPDLSRTESGYPGSTSPLPSPPPLPEPLRDSHPALMEDDDSGKSPSSVASDYDNMNGMYDNGAEEEATNFSQQEAGMAIPMSRSDGFVSHGHPPDMLVLNGRGRAQMKVTRTENDLRRVRQQDRLDSRSVGFHNGYQVEQQTSFRMSQETRTQTRTVNSHMLEKTAYL